MIVCVCYNVSERKIREAVDTGMTTMPELRTQLGVGTCCGKCHSCAKTVLRECLEERELEAQPSAFAPALAA
ncbi:bacterioferritin-associated ferredoxin [Noviherbaspirillum sp. UKPF54]|uniref:(2Fe-2S)-binding protein n=1 Tax=Noviherbaspirillum sp. UKPF54 TaxID=2601898 RepID=UPI0011B19133|nr:(2Fe-2S)-binding protein [Noviherbaspirillum sp. UKPF54]QDZ26491.1 regulatory or redox protein complexing with Bfr, in iron storage and mobility [Noviherbaspirillum sp. UKPF54]